MNRQPDQNLPNRISGGNSGKVQAVGSKSNDPSFVNYKYEDQSADRQMVNNHSNSLAFDKDEFKNQGSSPE